MRDCRAHTTPACAQGLTSVTNFELSDLLGKHGPDNNKQITPISSTGTYIALSIKNCQRQVAWEGVKLPSLVPASGLQELETPVICIFALMLCTRGVALILRTDHSQVAPHHLGQLNFSQPFPCAPVETIKRLGGA